jgi:hypothetical protein
MGKCKIVSSTGEIINNLSVMAPYDFTTAPL